MQGERPNAVAVLFLHIHELVLPESRSMRERAPTWIRGQDSVCIWYMILFRQNRTDRLKEEKHYILTCFLFFRFLGDTSGRLVACAPGTLDACKNRRSIGAVYARCRSG